MTIPASSRGDFADPLVGRIVAAKYRVLASIAAGGMGKVYRAEQLPLGRPVALKVLHPKHTDGPEGPSLRKRFLREASILSKLQHPNIVTVFDYGKIEADEEGGERLFMAMEYLSGETLLQRLIARGRLPWQECVGVAKQLARGLREAHARGIVHRDLKPSNVMILKAADGEERVKIVDFGIVKVLEVGDNDQELTQEGSVVGSPNYMAPEQITTGKVDPRSDMYSLGVILYQCLTGRFPFEVETPMQMMVAHVSKPPIPLLDRTRGLKVPAWLDELVMRCLAKSPDKRPQAMDEVLRAIQGDALSRDSALRTPAPAVTERASDPEPLVDELSSPSEPPAPPSARAVPAGAPRTPARSLPATMAVVVVAAALGGMGVLALRTPLVPVVLQPLPVWLAHVALPSAVVPAAAPDAVLAAPLSATSADPGAPLQPSSPTRPSGTARPLDIQLTR
jgi:serine/threonine protein kinase